MADSLVISLGAQCWVAKLMRDLFPHMDGPSGVFDWIGTTPAMVAHCLVDDFRTLCDPDRYRAMGKNGGNLQHTFYEEYIVRRLMMNQGRRGVALGNLLGLADYNSLLPALFIHNTQGGVHEMCDTLRRRGERLTVQLDHDGLKVLVWGIAIPYHHWTRYHYAQERIEEMMEEELGALHQELMRNVQVESFCLVGLLVIHGVPRRGLVADEVIPVAPIVRDMYATMKRIGLMSKLRGAKFSGPFWPAEKNDILDFLLSCENMMINATIERLAPHIHEVPGTRLAGLALLDADDDEVDSVAGPALADADDDEVDAVDKHEEDDDYALHKAFLYFKHDDEDSEHEHDDEENDLGVLILDRDAMDQGKFRVPRNVSNDDVHEDVKHNDEEDGRDEGAIIHSFLQSLD